PRLRTASVHSRRTVPVSPRRQPSFLEPVLRRACRAWALTSILERHSPTWAASSCSAPGTGSSIRPQSGRPAPMGPGPSAWPYLASLPTQLGVLGAIATLTATGVDRVARLITGPPSFTDAGVPNGDPYAITWMFVTLAGTVVATVAMGLLARVEAARVDPAARRRLAVTRFAGGMTLTIGAAIAVLSGVGGGLGRPMEPILGEVVLLLVATIL